MARRSSASASAEGSASWTIRPGSSTCAFVTGMPNRRPAAWAAASAASTTRLFPVAAYHDERHLRRRRRVASLPPQPVGGPTRQEKRDDPCHHMPPTRNLHFHRHEHGSVRQANGGARRPELAATSREAPRCASESWPPSAARNRSPLSAVADVAARFRSSRCQLQAARGGHGKPGNLAEDCTEPAMPQAFFHAGEHGLVVTGFDIDHSGGRQPDLGDRRGEEVRPRDAPEDIALGARRRRR